MNAHGKTIIWTYDITLLLSLLSLLEPLTDVLSRGSFKHGDLYSSIYIPLTHNYNIANAMKMVWFWFGYKIIPNIIIKGEAGSILLAMLSFFQQCSRDLSLSTSKPLGFVHICHPHNYLDVKRVYFLTEIDSWEILYTGSAGTPVALFLSYLALSHDSYNEWLCYGICIYMGREILIIGVLYSAYLWLNLRLKRVIYRRLSGVLRRQRLPIYYKSIYWGEQRSPTL